MKAILLVAALGCILSSCDPGVHSTVAVRNISERPVRISYYCGITINGKKKTGDTLISPQSDTITLCDYFTLGSVAHMDLSYLLDSIIITPSGLPSKRLSTSDTAWSITKEATFLGGGTANFLYLIKGNE